MPSWLTFWNVAGVVCLLGWKVRGYTSSRIVACVFYDVRPVDDRGNIVFIAFIQAFFGLEVGGNYCNFALQA